MSGAVADEAARFLLPGSRPKPGLADEYERPASELLAPADEVAEPLAGLLGVPFDTTTLLRRGSRFGPQAIRQGFAGCLSYDPNWGVDLAGAPRLADFGDVDVLQTDVEETWRRVSTVTEAVARNDFPLLVIGGDHGATFPVLRGVARTLTGNIGVINVDAHFDVRVSQHGEVSSGVPFRYVLERLDGRVAGRNFVEFGVGGWRNTRLYHDWLREQDARVITARELHRGDFDALLREALERASDGTDGVWLSIDLDAIESAFMPGVATPAIAGIGAMQTLELVWTCAQQENLLGMDLMELSPPYDPTGISAHFVTHMLLTFLAGRMQLASGR